MLQKREVISISDFNKGLFTNLNLFQNEKGHSPNCMNVKWNHDGSIQKRYGSTTQNTVALGSTATAGFTVDASGTLTTSLQAWWNLNETTGSRSDSYGTNSLSDNNSVLSESGIRGLAAAFVASNSESLVIQTTGPVESGSINFSMSAWVYLNSTSTTVQRAIMSKREPPIDGSTVLLLHCDGSDASTTFTDSSPSAKTVTANGNAQIDTAQQKFGTASGLFDGTGDYLSVPDSDDWDFGTGDWTIDFWVRIASTANSNQVAINNGGATSGVVVNLLNNSGTRLEVSVVGTNYQLNWTPSIDTWYHVAVVRNGNVLKAFVDGSQIGSDQDVTGKDITGLTGGITIAGNLSGYNDLNGWLDEVRISKGVARWTSAFTAPTRAYSVIDYEYFLFINTDNRAVFRVSSSGLAENATVIASSAGVLATTTWYRIVAWHSNGQHIGIDVNLSANTALYTSGVRISSSPLVLGAMSDSLTSKATGHFDGRIDEAGFWKKSLSSVEKSDLYNAGAGNTYSNGNSNFGWAMYDFGASALRWVTVAAGTGIYASSNLGVTFVSVATTRTQNYQYFERSKNVLVATSDSYDQTLYWAGSVGTFFVALAVGSAPSTKYSINHQGFLILLNSSTRKRGFFYADDNSQLTSTWTDVFDLPSTADDEITAPFTIGRTLYVSTRYRIFRVSFVGGNPDWSYQVVKDWGYVPRTVRKITLSGQDVKGGEVVVGMDWQRNLRVFDGVDDLIVSDSVETDNHMCDFAMEKISFAGSGLVVSHAVVDPLEQEYRLNVAIGSDSSQTTHSIILNGRSLAFYPYSNQEFQAAAMCESANRLFLLAVDRSGRVHLLNTGNLDVTRAIDEVYDSPFIFKTSPVLLNKSQKIDLYFNPDSSGSLIYRERADFNSIWKNKETMMISEANSLVHIVKSLDIPSFQNIYQFGLTSSSGTAMPWRLTRADYVHHSPGGGMGNR